MNDGPGAADMNVISVYLYLIFYNANTVIKYEL